MKQKQQNPPEAISHQKGTNSHQASEHAMPSMQVKAQATKKETQKQHQSKPMQQKQHILEEITIKFPSKKGTKVICLPYAICPSTFTVTSRSNHPPFCSLSLRTRGCSTHQAAGMRFNAQEKVSVLQRRGLHLDGDVEIANCMASASASAELNGRPKEAHD